MNRSPLSIEEALFNEINNEIEKRQYYGSWNFRLVHILLWVSILTSFASAIIVAAGIKEDVIPSLWVAIIAGIPGLVISIEKTFDFGRRSSWDIMYEIELKELRDDLIFKKTEPYEAAKKLREIIRRNETAFSKIGFLASNQPEHVKDKEKKK